MSRFLLAFACVAAFAFLPPSRALAEPPSGAFEMRLHSKSNVHGPMPHGAQNTEVAGTVTATFDADSLSIVDAGLWREHVLGEGYRKRERFDWSYAWSGPLSTRDGHVVADLTVVSEACQKTTQWDDRTPEMESCPSLPPHLELVCALSKAELDGSEREVWLCSLGTSTPLSSTQGPWVFGRASGSCVEAFGMGRKGRTRGYRSCSPHAQPPADE